MRIANNVMAANTHRFYSSNNAAVSKSAEKLSSGYRINRAGDDAAGLAISEKMRAQVRGMNMASKNSQDAVSLVQTAEGALQEVHSMLQRMNEMAVQSASGTNQNLDRQALQLEFANLQDEVDQVANTTNFNDMKLLTGDLAVKYTVSGNSHATTGAGQNTVTGQIGATTTLTNANLQANLKFPSSDGAQTVSFKADGAKIDMLVGGRTVARATATDLEATAIGNLTFKGIYDGSDVLVLSVGINGSGTGTAQSAVDIAKKTESASVSNVSVAEAASTPLTIQVGATQGENLRLGVEGMTTTSLGVTKGTAATNTHISTQTAAQAAITKTRDAINTVSTQRAALGAMQNRLEHKIANLNNTSENLSAAESRIRDVDMASEMTAFTKKNILSQAATAMLAQANSAPQNVLSLLR